MTSRIVLEELAALPTVTGIQVARGGGRVAFYADWTGRFEVYVMDLRSRERRQLTDGQAPVTPRAALVWSADDTHLYYGRDERGDERQALHEVNVQTGAVRALHHAPGSMDYPVDAHPDGRRLLVNSTRGGQMNVHQYDLTLDGEAAWTALTARGNSTQATAYSPDGAWVAVNSNDRNLRNMDVYVMGADGGELRCVLCVRDGSKDVARHWHPDSTHLTVTSDATGVNRAGLLNVTTGEVQWLGGPAAQDEETAGPVSADGRWVAVTRNVDSVLTVRLYGREGEARDLMVPRGMATFPSFVLGGAALLFDFETSATRPETLLYHLETDQAEVLLPAEYGTVDPASFVPAESVHYPTTDGQRVPALLYRPRDRTDQPVFAALVNVHGGPTSQFFQAFDPRVQFLVDRGYVVLCPNVRGSTGYGVAWRDANLLDWGGRDLEDVAAGAAYLKTLPFVDPARVGVFGGSYGGYLAYLAAVKKPDVFRVSVPVVGITDLAQLHADNSRDMPQLGYYFRTLMGDPVEQADLWRDRSAISFAGQLKAHMFMMHGANDPRCPVNQARSFRDALVAAGRVEGQDFEYMEFDDEGHGSAGVAGKTRSYRLLADYLDRHL